MLVKDFVNDFRSMLGDETLSIPEDFLIAGLNWALRDLPANPKLAKIFAHHFTFNLDAEKHWRWDLSLSNEANKDGEKPYFDYIMDIEYLNFWTSTGGDVCRLNVCPVTNKELYNAGLPQLMTAGKPCKYTLEREENKLYLVLDKPSDVPIIIDYIAYGIPAEVKKMEDEVPISKLCENAIIGALQGAWYQSATDMAFSVSILQYMDNKVLPSLIQEINKRFKSDAPVVLGN